MNPAHSTTVDDLSLDEGPVLVTTQEAARLCRVHSSSIKRWCDSGELPCQVTAGGHRRIALRQLAAFAAATGLDRSLAAFGSELDAVWRAGDQALAGRFAALVRLWHGWLMADRPTLLGPSMLLLLERGLPLAQLLDQGLGGLMRQVGEDWETGRIGVSDEHRASEQVMDALHALRAHLASRAGPAAGPHRAVVAAAEGDPHQLGAFMVRLLLEARGITVGYLGADLPGEDLAVEQHRVAADLVCVSFTPPRGPGDALRLLRSLAQAYDPASPYHLVLGGAALAGRLPALIAPPFRSLQVLDSLVDLDAWLDRLLDPGPEAWIGIRSAASELPGPAASPEALAPPLSASSSLPETRRPS